MGAAKSSDQGGETEEPAKIGFLGLWPSFDRFEAGCVACCSKCRRNHNENAENVISEVRSHTSRVFFEDEKIFVDLPRDSFATIQEKKDKSPMTQRDAQREALMQLQPRTPTLENIQHCGGETKAETLNTSRRTRILPPMRIPTEDFTGFDIPSNPETNSITYSGLHIG